METEKINDRIKYIISQLFGGNATKFARELGISQSTVKDILGSKQNSPSFETIKKILGRNEYHISPEWLLFNTGEFQKPLEEKPSEDFIERMNDLKETILLQKKVLAMQEEELKKLRGE